MDNYLPRLTAVLDEQGHTRGHGREHQSDDEEEQVLATVANLSLLRELLSNQSAIDALRLPHYVFDGQIEQKLHNFDEELLGGTSNLHVPVCLICTCAPLLSLCTAIFAA